MSLEGIGCYHCYSFVDGECLTLSRQLIWSVYCRQAKKAGFIALGYLNQLAIVIGNSVLWPIAVIAFQQLKAGYFVFHAAAVQPVLDVLYLKYKYVEDLTYIYLLGPVCQKFIDTVPDKNPFAGTLTSVFQNKILLKNIFFRWLGKWIPRLYSWSFSSWLGFGVFHPLSCEFGWYEEEFSNLKFLYP